MNDYAHNPERTEVAHQADDRLIHALLLHMHDDQATEHREQRVQRAIAAIRAPANPLPLRPAAHGLRFPIWVRRGVAAAAAMILVAVGMWVFTYSPTPALASLNDIISALGRPGDRSFHIQMEDLPEPPGRRPSDDQGMVPRPSLNDARLYLRDGRQYMLIRHNPQGGLIYDGFDGQQSWRVRNGIVAEKLEGLGAGGIPMPPMMADVPLSDLSQTLQRIRVDYTVEQLNHVALPSGGEVMRHVKVRRNSHAVKGPETIEIWADPKNAMPKCIIFDRAKIQGNPAPCRLTLNLVSEETLSADWFAPTSHTAGKD